MEAGCSTRKRRSTKSESSESEDDVPRKKTKSSLDLLADELLTSDSSDESWFDYTLNAIPASPLQGRRSEIRQREIQAASAQQLEEDHSQEEKIVEGSDSDYAAESNEEEDESEEDECESDSHSVAEKSMHETWKTFYQRGEANHFLDKLLVMFYQYLQDIIGGCKKERNALEQAQRVRRVMESMNQQPNDSTLSSLLDGGIQIWRKFAKPLLDKKEARPGTIKAALNAIVNFLQFLLDYSDHKVKGMPAVADDTLERARQMLPRISTMSSSVNRLYNHEKWEQILEEQVKRITPEDTSNMIDSEPAKEAIELLVKSSNKPPSESEFVAIRDFLIARIGIENGQRPGPLETARLRDFERLEEKDGTFMFVTRHKRSRDGPAPLTLSPNLKSNLETKIKNVRPVFAAEDEEAIFVNTKGVAFPDGTIGKRITEWWRKATGKPGINSTRIRKMHASTLHKASTVDKRSAHRLMCPSSRTAENYYMKHDLGDVAVHGHTVLSQNIGLKDTIKTGTAETVKTNQPSKTENKPSSPQSHSSPSKGLSTEQLDDIDLLFSNVITTNAPFSAGDAKNGMSESINLVDFVEDHAMVMKVYKRVKYMQGKEYDFNLSNVDKEDAMSKTSRWVESISSSRFGGRRSWAAEDEKTIDKAFKTHKTCPQKTIIISEFEGDAELQEIAKRNTMDRCYEKVKNLFKKRK